MTMKQMFSGSKPKSIEDFITKSKKESQPAKTNFFTKIIEHKLTEKV
ncbi:TPA: hypothetical protein R1156_004470 [Yersinia enterocolitica]|nr:hypothetical protein [Yersinia enterocolitica]